ncbi:ATP-dependent DNA helicase DinG [Motilimonas cestriensis]|uniref:ATP-dependent DNA helicase DinG n=1 Tax=Motilimonas cestriensis TaxID=2742685 RepID=A0ABS8WD83_9GAMM|nr:ATP-dependent DNA helicase DinG [Motilimonas cestriensis]MCE2595716.1 ATP-dependent DNA helicase DinG [Motilimonas cestriensis]
MLKPQVKQLIRETYQAISQSLPDYQVRKEQNYLVAEIAKTLAGEYDPQRRILVAEAGTGIGKSLAYLLGGLAVAQNQNKKLVISTATVTLQEQLINKDLPFFLQHSSLKFTFTLVKGRGRYCCEHKLREHADPQDGQQALWDEKPKKSDIDLIKRLFKAYQEGKWQGDRDTWPMPIADHVWQQIVADKHSCSRALSHHHQCPFHRARDELEKADVLIVNHALLLADTELGGGIILPDPDSCFYVMDEAHHLPSIARDFASANIAINASINWLGKLELLNRKIAQQVSGQSTMAPGSEMVSSALSIKQELGHVATFFNANTSLFQNESTYRFAMGELPEPLTVHACAIRDETKTCLKALNKLLSIIAEQLKDGDIKTKVAEPLMADVGSNVQRLENFFQLWFMLAKEPTGKHAPLACWAKRLEQTDADIMLAASPIEVGGLLENQLWSRAAGVFLCSATLTALNSFDFFRHQSGLKEQDGTQYLRLRSPFDYDKITLQIPPMRHEPGNDAYDKELCELIPALLAEKQGNLVLFASYWQMRLVAEKIKSKVKAPLLLQGELSRSQMLEQYKSRCDKGETAIMFGTGSLSEGLDLPGHYLTNLIITKLPFAVPTSPVEEAHAEWIESKGGNAFLQITIPEASKKLIQSCGRLVRKENDWGKITILDRRLVTRRYGKGLLDALPPFKRDIQY